ncbi:MAG TPA: amidohydrolase family protein, partial [Pseudolysinimonas sp.]|nr:amidohydrolase family protein [Pseudolysinimonas sp.]
MHGPDLVLVGGTVRALDAAGTVAEALAITGGTITALGGDAAIGALATPRTRVIELAGRTVIPGINDGHLHGCWLGARWPSLFFGDEGHPPEGRLVSTESERRAALLQCWGVLASLGITSYTEPGIGPGEDEGETGCFGTAVLDTYRELAATPAQTVRVTLLRLFGLVDGATTLDGFRSGLATTVPPSDPRWLAVPGVKIFADGIPPMGTAWTIEPYPDGSHGGLLTGEGDEGERRAAFAEMVGLAHRSGAQIAVHATGDRAIEEFVSLIENLGGAPAERPHHVVHGDLVTAPLLARMRAAGIGIAVQPLIAAHTGEWVAGTLGPEAAAAAWPLESMLDEGLVATLGSDAPIASPDWRRTIAAAAALLESRG